MNTDDPKAQLVAAQRAYHEATIRMAQSRPNATRDFLAASAALAEARKAVSEPQAA